MAFDNGHALVIGIGTYQHEPRLNVPITAADAVALATVLRDPAFCGYPESQVTLLHDAAASRAGILAALDSLAAQAGEGDTVLLFFCGHGDYGDDGDYYLTTTDTSIQNRKVVSGTGLRQSELIDKLRAVKAKRMLLLVNACHSGELAPTLGPGEEAFTGTPLPAKTANALLSTGAGRIIITACREEQVSYIGMGGLTLFTQALINGLKGIGTSSSRGYLSVFDLYTHLYFTISEAVQQKYGKTQEPELTVLKGVGPFAVALYRGATTLGEFDAAATLPDGTAVREVSAMRSKLAFAQLAPRHHQQTIGDNARVGAAVAGDVQGNISVNHHEEHIDAQAAEGFINHPTGSVSQVFGGQRNIDTDGGAYIEKSGHHIGIAGGNFNGPTIGTAHGLVTMGNSEMVQGDKISLEHITSTSGIAIGRGANANVVIGRGANANVVTGPAAAPSEADRLRAAIKQRIAARPESPDVGNDEIEDKFQTIWQEASAASPNVNKIKRWLGELASVAPDIVVEVKAALRSPAAGFALAVQEAAK
jgi:uncharacterized caspase-like protein